MSVKRRGLGRNLEALLGDLSPKEEKLDSLLRLEGELRAVPLVQIQAGKYQPRKAFSSESLQELADSIRAQGVIQPIIVRSIADQRYEIIAGERRFRAAQLAELETIPALVRELPDEAALAMALIENIQREDLNPIEEAMGMKRLIDEFEMTHEHLANIVGKSRAAVTNLLRLLALPDDVKFLLEQGQLDMGHARALLTLPEAEQIEIARIIALKSLSVREAEQLVRMRQGKANAKHETQAATPRWQELHEQLSYTLGMKTLMKVSSKGRGKIVLTFKNEKELEKLLERLS